MTSIGDLQNGCYYICSSIRRCYIAAYGNAEQPHWKNSKPEHSESYLFHRQNTKVSYTNVDILMLVLLQLSV